MIVSHKISPAIAWQSAGFKPGASGGRQEV